MTEQGFSWIREIWGDSASSSPEAEGGREVSPAQAEEWLESLLPTAGDSAVQRLQKMVSVLELCSRLRGAIADRLSKDIEHTEQALDGFENAVAEAAEPFRRARQGIETHLQALVLLGQCLEAPSDPSLMEDLGLCLRLASEADEDLTSAEELIDAIREELPVAMTA
ncbi:MAG: hypothetical protein HY319_26825 [Armatimonadetes bacterium]|nr:hypothetical protein [Armatimonadota bacterium]